VWNSVVTRFNGSEQFAGARLKNVKTGEEWDYPYDGVFYALGHIPNTDLFKGQLDLDEQGYLITDPRLRTKIPGVFAAGDCVDHIYRQAVTAAGMGCMAAIEAERWLAEQ
jgi:thioredoxin reductase (NADPH)